ncbi:MAG: hypothetical protein R6V04_15490 [bacterium]
MEKRGVGLSKVYSFSNKSLLNVILSDQREQRYYPERPKGAKNLPPLNEMV